MTTPRGEFYKCNNLRWTWGIVMNGGGWILNWFINGWKQPFMYVSKGCQLVSCDTMNNLPRFTILIFVNLSIKQLTNEETTKNNYCARTGWNKLCEVRLEHKHFNEVDCDCKSTVMTKPPATINHKHFTLFELWNLVEQKSFQEWCFSLWEQAIKNYLQKLLLKCRASLNYREMHFPRLLSS